MPIHAKGIASFASQGTFITSSHVRRSSLDVVDNVGVVVPSTGQVELASRLALEGEVVAVLPNDLGRDVGWDCNDVLFGAT